MHTSNRSWTDVAAVESILVPQPTRPVCFLVLGVACAAGLLLAFQQVVQTSVLQGEARNRATTAYSDALWRCDFTRGKSQRASCHVQLKASRQTGAVPNAADVAKTEAVNLAVR